jgi:N-acetylneuraminate synthase
MTQRTFVIAEAGVNHNGSLDRAVKMVAVASAAGADAIKFQTFRAESLVTPDARKAAYQAKATGGDDVQLEMLKALELDFDAHRTIAAACSSANIEFMSTAFDVESLSFLVRDVGVRRVKIPSGEVTNAQLLLAAGRSGLPLLLSTGMATMQEIEEALGVLAFGLADDDRPPSASAFRRAFGGATSRSALASVVTVLQCTTAYPTPPEDVNLRAMDRLAETFGLPVGFSDHSEGTAVAVAAVARGACVVEKHFTLDRGLPGPDHAASVVPEELYRMIADIRTVEAALGKAEKTASEIELVNRTVVRKGLYAAHDIGKGDVLREQDIAVLRPENGMTPMAMWDLIGRAASRDYRRFDSIAE